MTRLADLAWPAVRERADGGAVLAVPIGSTEQHGPHLPLSTDTDIAVALCERLAVARAGGMDVLVAPALPYGSSGEHAGFAGTLSIGQEAVENVIVELVRSATDTFGRVVIVSAHGGNAEPVARAVNRLRAESREVLLCQPRWAGDPHAGRSETSLQLLLRPDAVDQERAVVGNTTPIGELLPQLRSGGVRAVAPSGVLGDPTGASAAEGADLLGTLAATVIAQVAGWLDGRR
jgi:mycofactocin system creatininase family protein